VIGTAGCFLYSELRSLVHPRPVPRGGRPRV